MRSLGFILTVRAALILEAGGIEEDMIAGLMQSKTRVGNLYLWWITAKISFFSFSHLVGVG